jgi:hypothetical protein
MREIWRILIDGGLVLFAGGVIFWSAFVFFLIEKPQTRLLVKIGIATFLITYLALHFLLTAFMGDNPVYFTVDDAGDHLELKEVIAVLLAAALAYATARISRKRLTRK